MNKNRIILINYILIFLFVVYGCHHDEKTYQSQKMDKQMSTYWDLTNQKGMDALVKAFTHSDGTPLWKE